MHFDGANDHEICPYITQMQGWLVVHNNNMLIGKMRYDMVNFYERGNLEMPFESSMCFYRLCGSLPQRRSGSEQPD